MVQNEWIHYDIQQEDSAMYQFSNNLKRIKRITIEWAKAKFNNSQE